MRIVITGASGHFGRIVADGLLERVDPADLILVTRHPDALAAYAARGADVRAGDFDDPASLPAAFAGGDRLLLISTDAVGRRVRQHGDAIDAAAAAGVRHVVYTSILRPEQGNPAGVVPDHLGTEEKLRASGLAWTFLRNSIYADLESHNHAAAAATGQLVTNAGDGRVAYVAREDCAAAATAVLASDGHEGQAYDITGPEPVDAAGRAAVFAELGGGEVEVVHVGDAEFVAGLQAAAGLPVEVAELYASFGRATREGWFDVRTDTVEALTGRPPRPLRAVLESARAAA